jgi:hypothetical protein
MTLPNQGVAIVAMSNSEFADPKSICDALLDVVVPAASTRTGS